MTARMVVHNETHVLECRNVSNIRTLTASKWYNRIYSPKVTAQFLKEISLVVRAGEIHGVVGNAGSGKTTLLKVISRKCAGEFTGQIMLNQRPLTPRLFDSLCAFVNFNQPLIETISIRTMLKFQADMTVCGLDDREKQERIASLIREFDLSAYNDVLIRDLNEAARRRLLLCMHLIRDPVLTILDEPTDSLDALCSYQLMYSLSLYVKKTQRMAIVAVRIPRSDLYQLFTRITILFYGETIYSGITKELPLYFRQISFPCPANENPAIYYLSLATIDRETTERYRETQEQALKLVDLFKNSTDLELYQPTLEALRPTVLHQPLCFYGRPHCCCKFFVLLRRSCRALYSSLYLVLLRLLLLPLCTLLISCCCAQFSTADSNLWWPQNTAASLVIYCTTFSIVAIFLTVITDMVTGGQSRQDVTDGVCSEILSVLSLLFASAPNDLLVFISSILIIFWYFDAFFSGNWNFIWSLSLPLWCCYQYSQFLSLFALLYANNAEKALTSLIILCFAAIVCAGSFFVVPRTFTSTTDLRHILMCFDFYRYVLSFMSFKFIDSATVNSCIRNEHDMIDVTPLSQFCRWTNGTAFLSEQYPETWNYSVEAFNCYFIGLFVVILATVGLLCCTLSERSDTV